MARQLPWEIHKAPPAKRQRVVQTPVPKRERIARSDTEEPTAREQDTDERGRGPQKTPNLKKGSGWKSPSSSPVRAPPSTFEPMREGYDGDDIYIMVEDEFQTIAQSYTAHLHHAEYKRLVKQAREAPPKALPEPSSPMSKDAKTRLKIMALQKRQNDGLRQMTAEVSARAEEEDVDVEEEKVVDLWSGTSLAPLMAYSGRQKTSLIGLDGMSSKTKAGMGFARNRGNGNFAANDVDDEEDEEDLELARDSRQVLTRQNASVTDRVRSTNLVLDSEVSTRRRSPSIRQRSGESSKQNIPTPSSGLDGEPAVSRNGIDEIPLRRPRPAPRQPRNEPLKRKSEEQDKQSRLEDVPMFII